MVFDRLSVLTIRIHFTEEAGYATRRRELHRPLPLAGSARVVAARRLEASSTTFAPDASASCPYQSLKLYGSAGP